MKEDCKQKVKKTIFFSLPIPFPREKGYNTIGVL
jgi:hypothetical protein